MSLIDCEGILRLFSFKFGTSLELEIDDIIHLRPWMTVIIKMSGISVLICSFHLTAAGILKDNIVLNMI